MKNKLHKIQVKVQIEIREEAKDSFVATCPQLGCIFVQGETQEEAYIHVQEAIDLYVMTSIEHGDPIPDDVVISHEVTTVRDKVKNIPIKKLVTELDITSDYAIAASA